MKNLIILLLATTLFVACEDEATSGKIEGTLTAGNSITASDLNGINVYLWTSNGTDMLTEIDSVRTDDEGLFTFSGIDFGTYEISLKPNFEILPEADAFKLNSDNNSVDVSYTVEAASNRVV